MTVYPTAIAFAANKPGETVFYCKECTKQQTNNPLDNGFMLVERSSNIPFIRCSECRDIVRDLDG